MGRPLKQMVEAAAAGDAKAVRELIESTQNRLFKFCLVLCGDPVRAEDLAQDTFLRALSSLNKLKDGGAFIDWLFRIARNLLIDQSRKRREEASATDMEGVGQAPEFAQILAVHQVLSQFEMEDRLLLLLVDMENYTYRAAGEILGISEDAVRSRLFRLRKEFIEKFGKA